MRTPSPDKERRGKHHPPALKVKVSQAFGPLAFQPKHRLTDSKSASGDFEGEELLCPENPKGQDKSRARAPERLLEAQFWFCAPWPFSKETAYSGVKSSLLSRKKLQLLKKAMHQSLCRLWDEGTKAPVFVCIGGCLCLLLAGKILALLGVLELASREVSRLRAGRTVFSNRHRT